MKIKKQYEEIWQEYEDGKLFNQQIDLYDNVEKNERFFIGDQWHGVNAPNLMKPVFNIVKRTVSYFVAMLVSDDIAISLKPFDEDDPTEVFKTKVISDEIERIIERTKIKEKTRTHIKNCCVDGDTCAYMFFDDMEVMGAKEKYGINTEVIDNTNIIFGNPYTPDLQKQPYLLIIQHLFTDSVKDMVSEDMRDSIVSDDDDNRIMNDTSHNNLTTVITKMWKEKVPVTSVDRFGNKIADEKTTVKYMKTTKTCVIKEETDLGYCRYPVAYMTWEKVKERYHGQSPITGLIPNQIFINKMFAMCMVYLTNMGFPRIFYDNSKIMALTNDVSRANGVASLDILGRVIDAAKAPDFSGQVMQLIESTISYTKDCIGASDASLGNIKNPQNTSAIVAVQQATAVPLELQRLAYYDFMEDMVRNIIDMMATDYGKREIVITEQEARDIGAITRIADPITGQVIEVPQKIVEFDYSILKTMNYNLDISIGQSSYWNETTQIQTMDNLFTKGIITDATMYLEGIPDKYVPNKAKLIEDIREKQQQQEMLMQQQMMMEQGVSAIPEETMPA